jgi:hypothetical protein
MRCRGATRKEIEGARGTGETDQDGEDGRDHPRRSGPAAQCLDRDPDPDHREDEAEDVELAVEHRLAVHAAGLRGPHEDEERQRAENGCRERSQPPVIGPT